MSSSAFGSVSDHMGAGSWEPESDDWLHDPDKSDGVKVSLWDPRGCLSLAPPFSTLVALKPRLLNPPSTFDLAQHNYFSTRGLGNFATLGFLLGALLMLLYVQDR